MGREEIWLRAWCAVAGAFNSKPADCGRYADACLKAFDERFPARQPPEAQWCGVSVSKLSEKERKAMRDHVAGR